MRECLLFFCLACLFQHVSLGQVGASFTAPDTVCVNSPVIVTNTSTNASTFFWNFCVANSLTTPVGTNIGGSNFSLPVFSDYAKDGNNYYAFVTNNVPGKLVRLSFGNSLLNVPTYTDFGDLGGVIPNQCEGIQLVYNEGKWYAIIVGGQPVGRIVKVEFGGSLGNNSPLATSWGNIGNLAYPTDLHVFQDGTNWYGLTVNAQTNSITRFSFSSSFANMPTGVNIGNFGGMNYPTGIYAITKNGSWHAFITNAGAGVKNSTDASLTRLDFGASLLNTPVGTNLGNFGGAVSSPRDLTIYQSCNEIFGCVVGNATSKELVRLNFNNSLTAVPTASVIGNTGDLNFPHSISKLFRDNSDLYAFITNVDNNTVTRLKFSGCNTATVSNSTLRNPPTLMYSAPGVYNINLTVDDGLPSQSSFCRQVVVVDYLHTPAKNKTVCRGDSILLAASNTISNQWSTGSTASSIYVKNAGTYWVKSSAGNCTNIDSFVVTIKEKPAISLGKDTSLCQLDSLSLDAGVSGAVYQWHNGQMTRTFTATSGGVYYVTITKEGCAASDTITITNLLRPIVTRSADTSICAGDSLFLRAGSGTIYSWNPTAGLATPNNASVLVRPTTTTKYVVSVKDSNGCSAIDSVLVKVKPMSTVSLGKDSSFCTNDSLVLNAGNTGATYFWQNGATTQTITVKSSGRYSVTVNSGGCLARDSVLLTSLPSPVITLSSDTAICRLAAASLRVEGADDYRWWPASGLSDSIGAIVIAKPEISTKYYVLASSRNGCAIKDSILVSVTPMPTFSVASSKPFLCSGDTALLTASGGTNYSWSPALDLSSPFSGFTLAYPHHNTRYSVGIYDSACRVSDTLYVDLSVGTNPVIKLSKSNDISCTQSLATLTADGGVSYRWQPATGLSNPSSSSPSVNTNKTTTYNVIVRNSDGCEAQDSITIAVNTGDGNEGFLVPSAFTPNGDGRNDCFGVRWGLVESFSMKLFNRWGAIVFQTTDVQKCWNGVYKGTMAPGDVYVYLIEAKTVCGNVFRKGTFTLIR